MFVILAYMKKELTINSLIEEARAFCQIMSAENHTELLGVTDGKAVGTYVEHRFEKHLLDRYEVEIGNSAKGIDLPGKGIETGIKVTSMAQPQSSCPYKNARQKIFGLGYSLLLFVYDKHDSENGCSLQFAHCAFIESTRTSDYTTTKRLREMLGDGANKEDIVAFLEDRNLPGDEIMYNELAREILQTPPEQGYLTISNALQWRLQYGRIIELKNSIDGITNYDRVE